MEFKRYHFDSLASTLDTAADPKYTHGSIISADFQTAGRGQRGNKWHSCVGQNLIFSLVVCPTHIAVNEQFVISMITALAVARAIESYGIEDVTVKWPNDIYVGQKKICGILIEHSFSSEMLGRSIIGVGVNVAQTNFNEDSGNPTSLHLLGASDATPDDLLSRFCTQFEFLYTLSIEAIHQLYIRQLYRREGFFDYTDKDGKFSAKISAIDPLSGVMTLTDTNACDRSYYFKEVSYL